MWFVSSVKIAAAAVWLALAACPKPTSSSHCQTLNSLGCTFAPTGKRFSTPGTFYVFSPAMNITQCGLKVTSFNIAYSGSCQVSLVVGKPTGLESEAGPDLIYTSPVQDLQVIKQEKTYLVALKHSLLFLQNSTWVFGLKAKQPDSQLSCELSLERSRVSACGKLGELSNLLYTTDQQPLAVGQWSTKQNSLLNFEVFFSDIDECQVPKFAQTCSQVQRCLNTFGSYQCCPSGFKSNSTAATCIDVNECSEQPGICGSPSRSSCGNTHGSYLCVCHKGYQWPAGSKVVCEDINECKEDTKACTNALCLNNIGSYRCVDSCPHGYVQQNSLCEDVDECQERGNLCPIGKVCQNTEGTFQCVCPLGYQSKDSSCQDVNECVATTPVCSPPHVCINTLGGFMCTHKDDSQGVTMGDVTAANSPTSLTKSSVKTFQTSGQLDTEKGASKGGMQIGILIGVLLAGIVCILAVMLIYRIKKGKIKICRLRRRQRKETPHFVRAPGRNAPAVPRRYVSILPPVPNNGQTTGYAEARTGGSSDGYVEVCESSGVPPSGGSSEGRLPNCPLSTLDRTMTNTTLTCQALQQSPATLDRISPSHAYIDPDDIEISARETSNTEQSSSAGQLQPPVSRANPQPLNVRPSIAREATVTARTVQQPQAHYMSSKLAIL